MHGMHRAVALALVVAAMLCAGRGVGLALADTAAVSIRPAVEPRFAERGELDGRTWRWEARTVTWSAAGVDPVMLAAWRDAVAWAETVTGLELVEVDGAAMIEVGPGPSGGGVTWLPATDDVMVHVRVQLGCCRESTAWHELVHALGLGGHTVSGLMAPTSGGPLPPSDGTTERLVALYR